MSMMNEFKAFAMRGNVVDMAVGVVIGGAFGKIVSSLVKDVIMLPIGVITGGVDFSELAIVIQQATLESDAVTINYGAFIQNVIDFTIIAFAIFMVIKMMNKMKKKEEPKKAAPKGPTQEELLADIRDLLKKQNKPAAKAKK
mgnify:CR=1 FL=1